MYAVLFSKKAKKQFENLDKNTQEKIKKGIEGLSLNPYPAPGSKIIIDIKNSELADYRKIIGRWRILFDIIEKRKQVYILYIRIRNEKTYSKR